MKFELLGQLSDSERAILCHAITAPARKPEVLIEVGTWLGGGSTLHILGALHRNQTGHLWGIEADGSIYDQMLNNIRTTGSESSARFTPLFGFSEKIIPIWLRDLAGKPVDFVFLDGGNNPGEQIREFHLLDPHIPVDGQLMAHDAKMRKGKWLVPYLSRLDHWKVELHGEGNGLLHARKVALEPSPESRRSSRGYLLRLRLNPVEIAAGILPARLCGAFLRLMPRTLSRKLSDG